MPTISTTGQLENASREMIQSAIFTTEHDQPDYGLTSHYSLRKGEDTGVFPKFGQMNFTQRAEGEDITDEEDLGLTTVSASTNIYAAKVILTDRLLRQNVATTWATVGTQMGDAYSRIRATEIQSLYTGFSASLGTAGAAFSAANATACVAIAKTDKYGRDLHMIQHPVAVMRLAQDLTTIGTTNNRPIPEGYSSRLMSKAWSGYQVWDVPVFQAGDITRDSDDDAIGAIKDKQAIGFLEEKGFTSEKERDISLMGVEMVISTEFVAFEYDDARGASLTYDAADPSTSA